MTPTHNPQSAIGNPRSEIADSPSDDRVNLLLVDDRAENLMVMEEVLKDLGQNLVTAGSGREALRHILNLDFAVILLDVRMPEMDGFETAALIRQRKRSEFTPIIFVTALNQREAIAVKGYAMGAVDFMFKPIVPEILRAKVKAFIDLYRIRRVVEQHARQLAEANIQLEHEIAERKRAEEEISTLNLALEDKLQELEITNKELEAFSYSVSHDLRAPLRSMEGFSKALLEDYADKLDDQGKDFLNRIEKATLKMGQLIDDLLKLSRVTQSQIRISRVEMSALIREFADELLKSNPQREAEFIIAPDVVVQGDDRLLKIALDNLVRNAWKYTSKKPKARIEFGVADAEEKGKTVYYIKDNGAGFNMDYAGKLFVPFQRLHSETDFPGTGIGLAIVQRIMLRHSGRVWAEGEEGKGATFYFKF